ncbi:hypothetical protein [Candidatus Amarolinea dominans]|uniref:hypothetical protein n=1 Tax=Candidatus Amarolinea dominans TaxID=3140696 RepID=UPI001D6847D9|nr:hypothetical protein [Anaerolineae bacterium]
MTPQGHMFAGMITFSAERETNPDSEAEQTALTTCAQVQALVRASDPLYEIGFRLGLLKEEDIFWKYTLTALADFFGVHGEEPDLMHDVCSAIHPLGVASPFFRDLPLAKHGLAWVFPPAAIAHPLDDGSAVLVERSVETTAAQLGPDAGAYRRLMGPLAADWRNVLAEMLGPLRFPRHPISLVRFGLPALLPAASLTRLLFRGSVARAPCSRGWPRTDHAAGMAGDRCVRADAGHPGARGRLAPGPRRITADC